MLYDEMLSMAVFLFSGTIQYVCTNSILKYEILKNWSVRQMWVFLNHDLILQTAPLK
jgi:hypothetical protein